jgi:hypothetical protein
LQLDGLSANLDPEEMPLSPPRLPTARPSVDEFDAPFVVRKVGNFYGLAEPRVSTADPLVRYGFLPTLLRRNRDGDSYVVAATLKTAVFHLLLQQAPAQMP